MERSSRSMFLLGENFSDAEGRRHMIRLALLLFFCGICALLNRVGEPVPLKLIQPVVASVGSVNAIVYSRTDDALALRRELERERLRRFSAESRIGDVGAPSMTPALLGPDTAVWTCAAVLGALPSAWERQFVVVLEPGHAFEPGEPVFATTDNGIALVGRIIEVEPENARVLSITDPTSSIPVSIDGFGGGVLFRGGFPSRSGPLLYVPVDAMIKPGATVRAAWPDAAAGTLVGVVTSVGERDSLFMNVSATPTVRPENLRFVWLRRRN